MASESITASMLCNFMKCEHRLTLDLIGDPSQRDEADDFSKMLWENGSLFERQTIEGLGMPFLEIREGSETEREHLTLEAMRSGVPLIYAGRIKVADLLGQPDLLRREGPGYVAGDIKSGSAFQSESEEGEGKPKEDYAVQLALYTDILRRKKLLGSAPPFVWDVKGREVDYDLGIPRGVKKRKSFQQSYEEVLEAVREIVSGRRQTLPAIGAVCRGCCWRSSCLRWAEAEDDLTLIPNLGRSQRDTLCGTFKTVGDLARGDLAGTRKGKSEISVRLVQFQKRAQLQKRPGATPYFTERFEFPSDAFELFFDVETDPLRGELCYLHGFIERRDSRPETVRYVSFFAVDDTDEAERESFARAWEYVRSCGPSTVYHYSEYEKTTWKRLTRKFPDVADEDEVAQFFLGCVDLCGDVVKPKMIWPTRNHTIKTLATFLGFHWRDPNPSGAASIRWFYEWTRTGDVSWKRRILDYNEDDCRAMLVLLDGIKQMPVNP